MKKSKREKAGPLNLRAQSQMTMTMMMLMLMTCNTSVRDE